MFTTPRGRFVGAGLAAAFATLALLVSALPVAAGDVYNPATPSRDLDTRSTSPTGTCIRPGGSLPGSCAGVIGPGQTLKVLIGNFDGAMINVGVLDTTAHSFLTVWPDGQSRPN